MIDRHTMIGQLSLKLAGHEHQMEVALEQYMTKDEDTPRSYSFVCYPVCLSKS